MNLTSRKLTGSLMTLGLVVAGAALEGSTTAAAGAPIPGCVPASNVEAILDDSGSMEDNDTYKFRAQFLDAFASLPDNNGLVVGGVEFGSDADVLFGPAAIPGVISDMRASFAKVNADNGGTDFDVAFGAGNSHNPTANARIFLTDGLADMPSAHRSPSVKTYVIGLGQDIDTDVLSRVASDTGGPVPTILNTDAGIVPTAADVTSSINCKGTPITVTKTFSTVGQAQPMKFKSRGKNASVLVSWSDPNTRIVPEIPKRIRKSTGARMDVTSGPNFTTGSLRKIRKGQKVRFNIRAEQLSGPTTVVIKVVR